MAKRGRPRKVVPTRAPTLRTSSEFRLGSVAGAGAGGQVEKEGTPHRPEDLKPGWPVLSTEHNKLLVADFSVQDVRNALIGINVVKAPRVD
ncbi:hypothetical protein Dimus_009342, partial [Dionaea muscipula]